MMIPYSTLYATGAYTVPPSRIKPTPPPEPEGRPSAWDSALGFPDYSDSPVQYSPETDETPYRVTYEGQSYPIRCTLVEEGEEFFPSIDMLVPTVRFHGKLPYEVVGSFAGSVLVEHVSNTYQVPMKIMSYSEVSSVVELKLWGYGSLLCLGPVRDWVSLEDQAEAEKLSPEDIKAKLLQGNATVL